MPAQAFEEHLSCRGLCGLQRVPENRSFREADDYAGRVCCGRNAFEANTLPPVRERELVPFLDEAEPILVERQMTLLQLSRRGRFGCQGKSARA